jgi:hypothetical protein
LTSVAALCCAGCFTRPARDNAPQYKTYALQEERAWRINLPGGRRFDASGLFLEPSGDLLTESDQNIGVWRIHPLDSRPDADLIPIPEAFTHAQLAPFAAEKHGRYDCEGVTMDDQGRIYLCEEGDRWVLRYDPRDQSVTRLDIDFTPVKKYFSDDRNASFEGIAIHGSILYLANERKAGRIIVIDMKTWKVVDDFAVRASHSIWFDPHYSDLYWFDGALFILMREDHVILKVDPRSHRVLAEYSFGEMEYAPENAYHTVVPLVVGVMEGLAVSDKYFWLCTDNNGLARKHYPGDIRPTLFKCRRPDVP